MILIIGHIEENSVQEILNNIKFSNQRAHVIGHDQLETLINDLQISDGDTDFSIKINGERIPLSDIQVVWYRKTALDKTYTIEELKNNNVLNSRVNFHLAREIFGFKNATYEYLLEFCKSLGHPFKNDINKLYALIHAKKAGLKIPETLLTTSLESSKKFIDRPIGSITKSIQDSLMAIESPDIYALYTNRIAMDDLLENYEETIFPSYFQSEIDKEYEIRTFYFNGVCYSMAIFSQVDQKTAVDYRNYNWKKMNRMVPYKLPEHVENNITRFMQSIGLNTGSLDFIKSNSDAYVFLEVNPVGQFGFVSNHCNYYLEQEISNYLINCYYEKKIN
jgi:ATP-GRASP peptide maturase of grasp-with-spasm system